MIRTKDECTKALSMLGYQFKKRYWKGIKRNIPSGCSIRTLNNRPHLNSKPGVGRGRLDQVPICRGNVNSGKTLISIILISNLIKVYKMPIQIKLFTLMIDSFYLDNSS